MELQDLWIEGVYRRMTGVKVLSKMENPTDKSMANCRETRSMQEFYGFMTYLCLAVTEGMEKVKQLYSLGYIGTTVRILNPVAHSYAGT